LVDDNFWSFANAASFVRQSVAGAADLAGVVLSSAGQTVGFCDRLAFSENGIKLI
jgi:hypothetical protein